MVGNGGFSLRSKKFISACAKFAKEGLIPKYNPEDVILCIHHKKLFEENGMNFAPVPIAEQFAFEGEGLSETGWDGQFGFHGFRWTNISKWLEQNPQYDFKHFIEKEI